MRLPLSDGERLRSKKIRVLNMSFYEARILPQLINVAMTTKAVKDERRRCLESVTGSLLEVGFGTRLNLSHYPRTVTRVVGVDPSETSARLARKPIAGLPFPVKIVRTAWYGLSVGPHRRVAGIATDHSVI